MNDLFRGLATGLSCAPTMRSVRKMTSLRAALHEINRRPVGIDTIPRDAFVDPPVVIHGRTLERPDGLPQARTSRRESARKDISELVQPTKGSTSKEGERSA
jgi:hypothetical protein